MRDAVSKVFAVIMCGGSGSRLWPASRPSRPKQFVPLVGSTTLFEQTVTRVCGIADISELLVVAGERHAGWINAQTGGASVPTTMLLEPMARNSAPAIAAAVAYVEAINPQGVLIIVASDHFIPTIAQFHADTNLAVQNARMGGIVTLGIMPTEPSPAYGYIQPGFDQGSVGPLSAFFEKPDTDTAARYIEEGYLWNSGNFIARADTLAKAFEATSPDVLSAARDALKQGRAVQGGLVLGEPFKQAPKVSFDYAVMEKYDDLKVVRSSIEWSDLGAWDAVHTTMAHDARGNAHIGDALMIDADNCHVRATTDQPVIVAGVEGLNIIVEPDVVLVTALDRSQGVKQIVDVLEDQRQDLVDVPGGTVDLTATAKRWRQWLDTTVLPLWWSHGFDHANGLFRECLSHDGARPTGAAIRARVQGRQAFVYARAGKSGWPGPWRGAVKAGLNAAQQHYAGADGLMCDVVSADCAKASDAVRLYDQTFTLLALCHGRDIIDNAENKALAQLDAIEARFGRIDGGLGFCEAPPDCYQANAHMHLFEVAIDWAASGGDPRWTALANQIADFACDHLIDEDGLLHEFFSADWKPIPGDKGHVLEPGHQFEWAWLLTRWSALAGDRRFASVAHGLFDVGSAGIDTKRGVAILQMNERFEPLTDVGRLWSQTEWLKAAAVLARDSEPARAARYVQSLHDAVKGVDRFLDGAPGGLWFDKMNKDGSFVTEDVPASTLYHIIGAVEALEAFVADRTNTPEA